MESVETPQIESGKSLNIFASIWIVPIIALIISASLMYRYYAQRGSEISIDYKNSYGLIPKESVVKFRDVAVGTVTKIKLQEGGDGVTVIVRMNKEAEPYLNKNTKFWIVRPKVDYSGVKGIDTLLHGTYIKMYAAKKGELQTEFKGLEEPFVSSKDGAFFHLYTKNLGTILVGAPVYYRNLQAGSVKKVSVSKDKTLLDILIFMDKDFVSLINTSTKFWQQKLVTLSTENGKTSLEVAPLVNLLFGSIGFESRFDKKYTLPDNNYKFVLYDGYADTTKVAVDNSESNPKKFHFVFEGRVSGIHEGTKIGYSGFDVGRVDSVDIGYDPKIKSMKADVYATIDCSIFASKEQNGTANLEYAVKNGLTGVLKSDNPLVGKLYISLEYLDKESNKSKIKQFAINSDTNDFPTKKEVSNEVLSKLENLLNSFTELASESKEPLKDLLIKLNKSADSLNELMGKDSFKSLTDDLNETMGSINSFTDSGGELDKAIQELRKTLRATKTLMRGYSRTSLFGKKLEAMLKEVGKTSEETKRLMEKLNKKPNSLIFGD